jgi:hypothetical protein
VRAGTKQTVAAKPAGAAGPAPVSPARRRSGKAAPGRLARLRAAYGRWARRLAAVPSPVLIVAVLSLAVGGWAAVNAVYHVARKPTELFFPVSDALYKTPAQTWAAYGPLFRENATAVITAELLAALAQIEASGNPVVRTYWRWQFTTDLLDIYRPASSAVGMFQFTDGTFEEARRYCIRDHRVLEVGPWNDVESCWFNDLYFRVLPGHSVELTSAYLDRRVASTLARHRVRNVPLAKKHELATLIHLCGAGAGNEFVRRGFRLRPGQQCGAHDARAYLDKVARMKAVFARLAR